MKDNKILEAEKCDDEDVTDKADKKKDEEEDEMEEQIQDLDTVLDEATEAADSLQPQSKGGRDTYKSQMMAKMLKAMAGMKREDLSAFLAKTLEQVGKEDSTVPNNSGKNEKSISASGAGTPKPINVSAYASKGMKEDVDALFGESDLSEEFKQKIAVIFEAAVSNRVIVEQQKLQEQYEEKLEEAVAEKQAELTEQLDEYTNYVAEEWMKENELAVESGFRSEISESFMNGLKDLFSEHYVDVPEDKVDLVQEMAAKVEDLEAKLNETLDENIRLNNLVETATIEVTFDEVAEGLADTEVEKLKTLAEGIEWQDAEDYKQKLTIIKEHNFKEPAKEKTPNMLVEESD